MPFFAGKMEILRTETGIHIGQKETGSRIKIWAMQSVPDTGLWSQNLNIYDRETSKTPCHKLVFCYRCVLSTYAARISKHVIRNRRRAYSQKLYKCV